ncbi:MAG TPA: carboxypeptidase regulatory-like domain-containing protein [Acidobacteriaceae bacterium]
MALGQAQNTGTISGNVMDPQGKVVVGATITLVNTATNAQRTAESNSRGEYVFSDVAVGMYTLTVAAPLFETYVVEGVQLDADQNVRTDAKLVVGSASEQTTVQSEGTTVDTRSATIGAMIDNKMVENLPVDGNNVIAMAAMLPGVSNVNAPTTFTSDTGGPTFNISGSRNNQNMFLLDGVLWNNMFYNTGLNYPPRPMVGEMSILLNNFKAQYGRNVGSIVNVLTKSGSNTYHGSLWEYIQNHALNAADYISHLNPALVQNQFGATLGGPILRNKVTFFIGFQDLRAAQTVFALDETPTALERGYDVAPTATTAGVPHMCQYAGFAGMQCANFGVNFPTTPQVSSTTGAPTCPGVPYYNCYLRNPLESSAYSSGFQSQENAAYQWAGGTGTSPCVTALDSLYGSLGSGPVYHKNYMPYEEIPAFCFNPVIVNFMNKYLPLPNGVNAAGFPTTTTTAKQPRNEWDGLARVDVNLGRHTLDMRFYVTNANDVTSNSATTAGTAPGVAGYEQDLNTGGIYAGNIGDQFVVTPTMLNVLRVGYKRYNYTIYPTDHTTFQDLGSNLYQPAMVNSLPKIEVTSRFTVGSANSTYSFTVNENTEVDDNFTWTHGNHNFQFGAQYLYLQYLHRWDATPFLESEQQYTQANTADFLMGLMYQEQLANFSNLGAVQNDVYMYAQDDWRATSKLTLNYGLRYELPFAWHSADGQGVAFTPGFQSSVFPTAPAGLGYEGDPALGNASVRSRYNNLAPRLGFAYDLFGNGSTTIRGGIGIFYDAINAAVVGIGAPYHYSAQYTYPAGGYSQPLLNQPQIAPNYTKGSTYFGTPYSVNYADRNITTPYTEAVNIGFQRKVGSSGTLEMNYVAKFGRHQLVQFDQNSGIFDCTGAYYQANPIYCPVTITNGVATLSSTVAATSQQNRVTYPGYAYGGQGVVDNNTVGSSNYNSLQIQYRHRAKKSLSMQASYTYSKSLDIQSNGQTTNASFPMPKNLGSNYAVSDYDTKHNLTLGWVYNLPKTTHFGRPVRAVANGWIFGGLYSARTGMPINIVLAGDVSFTGDRPQRPLAVPGVNPSLPSNRHRVDKVLNWFNTAAFATPPYGTFGNVSRNTLRGPAFINTQFSLQRNFNLPKRSVAEFRVEAYNVFNTPNLANPTLSESSATANQQAASFATIQATVGTNGNVGTNGRRMQISLTVRY